MFDIALPERICASSKIRTSTPGMPRPNPRSRAPNKMRDPLWNRISSSPDPVNICRTCGRTLDRSANPCNDRNVSVDVPIWCAVQITSKPGLLTHSANVNAAIRYVLPTWRGRDMPTPSIAEASEPSARFARIRPPTCDCQGSKWTPSFSRHVLSTAGQPVATASVGADTLRAISESFGAPLCVRCRVGGICTVLLRPKIYRLDLLRNVLQPASQRRKITRRTLRIGDRLRNPLPHRHQQRPMIARRCSLSHRLVLLRLRRLLTITNSA